MVFLFDFPIGNASGGEQRVWYYRECRLLVKATLNADHVDLTILTGRNERGRLGQDRYKPGCDREIRRALGSL